ncbi:MAG: hypothetical protein IJ927_02660, partial [Eubacterium sp.]|nr:hypothetical protein [Eubacterium sp.]
MKKAVVILFILIPALIAVSIFAFPDNALSEQENRVLMTRDEISSNVKDGAFQSDLESFLSDQFPLRDSLAFAKSKIRYITGQMDINGAYICKSGRLIQKVTSADINEEALCSYSKRLFQKGSGPRSLSSHCRALFFPLKERKAGAFR